METTSLTLQMVPTFQVMSKQHKSQLFDLSKLLKRWTRRGSCVGCFNELVNNNSKENFRIEIHDEHDDHSSTVSLSFHRFFFFFFYCVTQIFPAC